MRLSLYVLALMLAGCDHGCAPVSPEQARACKEMCAPAIVDHVTDTECTCQQPHLVDGGTR